MRLRGFFGQFLGYILLWVCSAANAAADADTRLLRQPALSREHLVFALLCALSLLPFSAFCEGAHVATLAESLSRTTIRAPAISPNASSVAYLQRETNWKENEFVRQLWLVNAGTGKSVQLTRGKKSVGPAEWSPDGRWLAFVTEREANVVEPLATSEKDSSSKKRRATLQRPESRPRSRYGSSRQTAEKRGR